MAASFRHLTLKLDRSTTPAALRAHVTGAGRAAVTESGGVLWGAWSGQGSIGWRSDEAVVITAWPDGVDAPAADPVLEGIDGLRSVGAERLHGTVRPTQLDPLAAGGVVAQRWFDLDAVDWDEFVELSSSAWVSFEATYDAEILGFLRSDDVAEPDARVLLVTRYASFAEWERSRETVRATDGPEAEAGRRFIRRASLTRSTIVRVAPLLA